MMYQSPQVVLAVLSFSTFVFFSFDPRESFSFNRAKPGDNEIPIFPLALRSLGVPFFSLTRFFPPHLTCM